MRYDFLIESYETERVKVLSVWSEFRDERSAGATETGRSARTQRARAHGAPVRQRGYLVSQHARHRRRRSAAARVETRLEFIRRYAEDSAKRLGCFASRSDDWWEEPTTFFDVQRSRAWVMTRRLTHTSHHRGQQMAMLRMLGRELHSNYGPTADTGGLMQNHAPTIYAYASVDALLESEEQGGAKSVLPGSIGLPVTERPS